MTAPLKWRSQLCPCGYCPDGTRIEWRYRIDIRFRPRRRPAITKEQVDAHNRRVLDEQTSQSAQWDPDDGVARWDPPRARPRNVRKALGGSQAAGK